MSVIFALDFFVFDLPSEGKRCQDVSLHEFVVVDLESRLLDDLDLSPRHASDLHENVQLARGRRHI